MSVKLLTGDCREILPTLPDHTIDAVCCDPPYHLTTDKRGGSGDASIDLNTPHGRSRITVGFMNKEWDGGDIAFHPDVWRECLRVLKPGGYLVSFASCRGYHRMVVAIEDAGFIIHPMLAWIFGSGFPKACDAAKAIDRHLGTATGQWEGWAYGRQSLKPSLEPICLAQKPMIGTGAENLLEWGIGALNIDACRIPGGRWPANVILDGSDEVEEAFAAFGQSKSRTGSYRAPGKKAHGGKIAGGVDRSMMPDRDDWHQGYGDSGSPSRFFYAAKASKRERAGSKHPTIKPLALMEYLCKLICPPGGTILDPFAGSGTTGEAACNLGFNAILIERELQYVEDCRRRLALYLEDVP